MIIFKVTSEHVMAKETRETKYFKNLNKANQWIEKRTQQWIGYDKTTGEPFTLEYHQIEVIKVED